MLMARKRRWQALAGFHEHQQVFMDRGPQDLSSARGTVRRRRAHRDSQCRDRSPTNAGGHDATIRPIDGEEAGAASKRVPRPGGRAHQPGLPDGGVN